MGKTTKKSDAEIMAALATAGRALFNALETAALIQDIEREAGDQLEAFHVAVLDAEDAVHRTNNSPNGDLAAGKKRRSGRGG